jgi:hypothetical protein
MLPQTSTNRKSGAPIATPAVPAPAGDGVVIRRSGPGDGHALSRLARLESRRPLAGPHVVAELGDQVVAAVSLHGGEAIADPFMPTADLVALLELRARQLTSR